MGLRAIRTAHAWTPARLNITTLGKESLQMSTRSISDVPPVPGLGVLALAPWALGPDGL